MASIDCQLCIVGAGVSGMIAALLAKKSGIDVLLVEKQPRGSQHSNAHYLDAYTLDVLSRVGIDINSLIKLAVPSPQSLSMTYCYDFATVYDTVCLANDTDYINASKRASSYGACVNIRYDVLVKALLNMLETMQVKVRWESTFIALDRDAKRVRFSTLSEEWECQVDTLLACDGSHSHIRRQFVDDSFDTLQTFLSFSMHSDLTPYVAHPSLLYWIYHPVCRACLVAHDLSSYQVMQIPIFPPHESINDYSPSRLLTMMKALTRDENFSCQFSDISQWDMACYLAPSMQFDWVFLAGDSAHTMTPAGGLGLNTAIGDVVNFIWKLAHSYNTTQDVLISYGEERYPVAKQNVSHSFDNYQDFIRPAKVLGLDITYAPWVAKYLTACERYLPGPLASFASLGVSLPIDFASYAVRANNPVSYSAMQQLKFAIANNADHFSGIKQHLRFRYASNFFVHDDNVTDNALCGVGRRFEYVTMKVGGSSWKKVLRQDFYGWTMIVDATWLTVALTKRLAKRVNVVSFSTQQTFWRIGFDTVDHGLLAIIIRPDAIVAWCGNDYKTFTQLIDKWL